MKTLLNKVFIEISLSNETFWVFKFSDEFELAIECLWRLEDKRRILFTNRDHLRKFGAENIDVIKEIKKLDLNKITDIEINENYGDIKLEFDKKFYLNCINHSSGYEAWNLTGPNYWLVGKNEMQG